MRKEEKEQIIGAITAQLQETPNFYIVEMAGLNAESTSDLRRSCYEQDVKLMVVKNTLFRKVLESQNNEEAALLYPTLEGPTAIMFTTVANAPAKLIKDFAKKNTLGKPVLKGAYVQESSYVGAQNLDALVNIKSRDELLGDIIALLQAPARNVISALTASGGGKVAGLVKTLSEK